MPSTLDLCELYYGTRDVYKLMNLTKQSSDEDVKRAYYRLSLQVHPDRVAENYKKDATEKFKIIKKIKSVLIDPIKKALYDEEGIINDDEKSPTLEKVDNLNLWRRFFKPITASDVANFRKQYIGSAAEAKCIYESYTKGKGCLTYVIENVPFVTTQDEPRIIELITAWIHNGNLSEYTNFVNEPSSKRHRRHLKYGAPSAENAETNVEHGAISLAIDVGQPTSNVVKTDKKPLKPSNSTAVFENDEQIGNRSLLAITVSQPGSKVDKINKKQLKPTKSNISGVEQLEEQNLRITRSQSAKNTDKNDGDKVKATENDAITEEPIIVEKHLHVKKPSNMDNTDVKHLEENHRVTRMTSRATMNKEKMKQPEKCKKRKHLQVEMQSCNDRINAYVEKPEENHRTLRSRVAKVKVEAKADDDIVKEPKKHSANGRVTWDRRQK